MKIYSIHRVFFVLGGLIFFASCVSPKLNNLNKANDEKPAVPAVEPPPKVSRWRGVEVDEVSRDMAFHRINYMGSSKELWALQEASPFSCRKFILAKETQFKCVESVEGRIEGWSRDGKYIALSRLDGAEKLITVIERKGEQIVGRVKIKDFSGQLDIDSKGKRIALSQTHSQQNSTVLVFDISTGRQLVKLESPKNVPFSLKWSPYADYLIASGSESQDVWIWKTSNWKVVSRISKGGASLSWHPVWPRIAMISGGLNSTQKTKVRVFDVKSKKFLWESAMRLGQSSLSFNAKGDLLAVAGSSGTRLLRAETGEELVNFEEASYIAAFSPDGRALMVVADGEQTKMSHLLEYSASNGMVFQANE